MSKTNQPYSYSEKEKEAMMRQLSQPRYCIKCGQPLVRFSQDSTSEWEWHNSVHYECYKQLKKEYQGGR